MYNFKDIQGEVIKLWKNINLFSKLQEKNKRGKNYFYLDGPPYANFVPHVGHIRNTVYKDFGIRLAFMKGYNVFFQPGFDTHGLPVENVVEKKLELRSKKDIERIGVEKFTKTCRELAAMNKDLWLEVYRLLGSWYSWKDPYLTYNNDYIECGWWSFKQIWDKGLVYEGQKPVFWCPKCETALAGYEVTDSYVMKTDPSIILKFKVKDRDEYLIVFTTTPWTLLSNVAVVVHPEEIYVKVDTSKGVLILAKERLNILTDLEIGYKILREFKGRELDQLSYEPILTVPMQEELNKNTKSHKIYMSIPILKERVASKVAAKKKVGESRDIFEHFVNVEEGTGLVHTAPGHGKTDNEIGEHYGLPEASPLDDSCKFTMMGGQFEGMFVKDADKAIMELLENKKLILHKSVSEHKYPVCWRCKDPLIFRMSNQWFIKINRDGMVKLNKRVRWLPDYANDRFESWILNAEDWNISRQRYWGIPIPIWRCECGNIIVVGSIMELRDKAEIPDGFDLHNANNAKIKCECGKVMNRIRDIFDVWYDSGIAPWASLGYPYKNKELFEKNFPVSRINESQDQVRGWFYYLLYCAQAIFGKQAYMEVSMPGWVVDAKGQKMSKSLGNVIFAKDALEKYGADAIRFYYMWDIAPYDLQKFNEETIKKEVNKIFIVLWNLHNYILEQSALKKNFNKKNLNVEDRWILSKLNSLILRYENNLNNFEYHTACRDLEYFILNNFSREYIHFIRERVNKGDETPVHVMLNLLEKICIMLAPICPFISESIYLNMKDRFNLKAESIHLSGWLQYDKKSIDNGLEESFELMKEVVQEALFQRDKSKLGIRWPLLKAVVYTENISRLEDLKNLIMEQINVKDLVLKNGKFSVRLDTILTNELEMEGYSREIMRLIQDMRKKAGLKKNDRVNLVIISSYDLSRFEGDIMEKVGAENIEFLRVTKKRYKNVSKKRIRDYDFEVGFEKV